jgi:glycosyltransferase EpsE
LEEVSVVQPKVSVVTPVFNGEPYFDRALPAIRAQTFTDFEYTLLDDGTTARPRALLAHHAGVEPRSRGATPGRLGNWRALNTAVELARAPYIAIQDFDDVSYPERLALQTAFLDAHPEIGVVGGYYVVDDRRRNERYIRMPPTDHDALYRRLVRCVPFAHTIVMYRKTAWEQAGGYPKADSMLDLRLWITVVRQGWRLAGIPEVLGEHLIHPASYWKRTFAYSQQQRVLARIQRSAVRDLGLPLWMNVYPLGRYAYSYMGPGVKRVIRRTLGRSRERDL